MEFDLTEGLSRATASLGGCEAGLQELKEDSLEVLRLQNRYKQQSWALMLKKMRLSSAVESLRLESQGAEESAKHREGELRLELQTFKAQTESLDEERKDAIERSRQVLQSCEELKSYSEMERNALMEKQNVMLQEIQQKHEQEREALNRQLQISVQAAGDAAEQKAKATLQQELAALEARCLRAESLATSQEALVKELRAKNEFEAQRIMGEFAKYQGMKEKELKKLEVRVTKSLGAKGKAAKGRDAKGRAGARKRKASLAAADGAADDEADLSAAALAALSDIRQAHEADQLAAARRELAAERKRAASLERAAAGAKAKAEELKREAEDLRRAVEGLKRKAASDPRPSEQDIERLREDLRKAKDNLKFERANSQRRLRELKLLQEATMDKENTERLEAQRRAQAAVEAKLQQAYHAIDRKDVMVRELKDRLVRLQGTDPAQLHEQIAALQDKVRALQGSVSRKEALVQETRAQMEIRERAAAEAASNEESERASALSKRLRLELGRKEAALDHANRAVARHEAELRDALDSARAAGKKEGEAWARAGADATVMIRRASRLLETTQALTHLVMRNAAAMRTAARNINGRKAEEEAKAGEGRRAEGAAAGGAADAEALSGHGESTAVMAGVLARLAASLTSELLSPLEDPRQVATAPWNDALLESLLQSAKSEAEWAETLLSDAVGLMPGFEAWMEGLRRRDGGADPDVAAEAEGTGRHTAARAARAEGLREELARVSQRMAWTLEQSLLEEEEELEAAGGEEAGE